MKIKKLLNFVQIVLHLKNIRIKDSESIKCTNPASWKEVKEAEQLLPRAEYLKLKSHLEGIQHLNQIRNDSPKDYLRAITDLENRQLLLEFQEYNILRNCDFQKQAIYYLAIHLWRRFNYQPTMQDIKEIIRMDVNDNIISNIMYRGVKDALEWWKSNRKL